MIEVGQTVSVQSDVVPDLRIFGIVSKRNGQTIQVTSSRGVTYNRTVLGVSYAPTNVVALDYKKVRR